MAKGWRNEGQGVRGQGSRVSKSPLEGEGQESAEGVGKDQKYQGRSKKIGQAEGSPAPGGLQAGGGPWAWDVT